MSEGRTGPGTGLLLDAAGTLLRPAVAVAQTYAEHARRFGVEIEASHVAARFGSAMREAAPLRRRDDDGGDWTEFWATVVARSTGCDAPALVTELIEHFAAPAAWTVAPGAERCCARVRATGTKIAVVSNWDRRLRPLLTGLGVLDWIDVLVVSGEEGLEKPDPALFTRACARLGVLPDRTVHVGDDPVADVEGARAAGCAALWFGHDVADFDALAQQLLGS